MLCFLYTRIVFNYIQFEVVRQGLTILQRFPNVVILPQQTINKYAIVDYSKNRKGKVREATYPKMFN